MNESKQQTKELTAVERPSLIDESVNYVTKSITLQAHAWICTVVYAGAEHFLKDLVHRDTIGGKLDKYISG